MAHDKSIKLKYGHKYARMQQFPIVSHQTQKILDKYAKHIKPEMFNAPQDYTSGMDILRQGMQQPPIAPVETGATSYLQNILSQDPEMMKQFEAPYMRQFNEQILPDIANRYAGAGAVSSGGFKQAMAHAATDLQERLAGLRTGAGLQAAQAALPYAQMPLQRQQQQFSNTQNAMQAALYPQQMQEEYNRYAQNRQFQQRNQVLGTPTFQWNQQKPQQRDPGFWRSALPGFAEGFVNQFASSMFG